MVQPSLARLRRALERELPSKTFDEHAIAYFADSLGLQSEADMVKTWSPFLFSHGAAVDDEAAAEVCRAVLRRLQEDAPREQPAESSDDVGQQPRVLDAEVFGLAHWLERLGLEMYALAAHKWCARVGATCAEDVLNQAQTFCTDLGLKTLQRRRVMKEAEALVQAIAPPPEPPPAAEPAMRPSPKPRRGTLSAAELVKIAEAQGHQTIGPPLSPNARYIVLGELGRGATASVKRCISIAEGLKERAVKMIPLATRRTNADAPQALARVRREIQNMKTLDHEHVVKLCNAWESQDTLYVIMELVKGGELRCAIPPGVGLTEPETRHVFVQLVEALQYMHSKSLVHRDLKLDNILVDSKRNEDGLMTIKISDFGSSKLAGGDDGGALTTQAGTPEYWAPEVSDQRTAAGGYGKEVDLWSLGVVLYVMLEGVLPFHGDRADIDENVRKANFSFRPESETSPEARDLIGKLIQVRPQDRLPLKRCLKHSWVTLRAM